ncbi:MAG: hypothetical protein HXX10_20190 [Rhodoplanes sp.]|uniref:hypothetical protein n=1 Tax=Rhodoplanes sp. TaxID=1968906 RepID=UPI00179A028D|nr:hypothetical protein [Rhodoplanes sp.]NVO16356.1 hypothetical protein [Rhodoplanes sp.]
MKPLTKMCIGATVALAVVTGPALAQSDTPKMSLPTAGGPEKRLTSEELERRKAVDEAYQSAIKKIPNQAQKVNDPWATVRPPPSSSSSKPSR